VKRLVKVVFAAIGALVLVVVAFVALRTGAGPLPDPDGCTATVQGHTVRLDTEQAENAALIVALSVRRGLPPRAASIALATAYQESKIYNLEHGDRDSVGLFQQRPSQGWGTRAQILDPVYAINRFYDELLKVDGYDGMRITEAAQKVQRSGFPEAYAAHEADARALASALTGETPGGRFSCIAHPDTDRVSQRLDARGLTRRAAVVRQEALNAFGDLPLGGFEAGGVSTGHMKGSTHYQGRAVDMFVRPVNEADNAKGWAIAQYFVAQADRLSVEHVIFDGRIWTSGDASEKGWRRYDPGDQPGDRAVLLHRDHVHVDVYP
jgi:hypothetical protein